MLWEEWVLVLNYARIRYEIIVNKIIGALVYTKEESSLLATLLCLPVNVIGSAPIFYENEKYSIVYFL